MARLRPAPATGAGRFVRARRTVRGPGLIGITLGLGLLAAGCGHEAKLTVAQGSGPDPQLPAPDSGLIPTVNVAKARPWRGDEKPVAAEGLQVNAFARELSHPRWLYVLPNGDVLVAESNAPERPQDATGIRGWISRKIMAYAGAGVPSADRITLLRDRDGDGRADTRHVFVDHLHSPFGMALVGRDFYVANTDAIVRFDYARGDDRLAAPAATLTDLPAGPINHHWTKNIIASPDGETLYATVGSNSNIGENGLAAEEGRAAIWAVDRDSGDKRVYASGLRNPNGMAFVPATENGATLWVAVNERDALGSDLVPDYMTSVVDGGFYGWPYSYYGDRVDTRVQPQRPDRVARAIEPDYALGPHTASLGLAYSESSALPERYARGMFVGQHGSWNRKPRSGYRVVYVAFDAHGEPAGRPIDVLTGFVDADGRARGRPVGVALSAGGDLLVADDVGNTIWRVSRAGP